MMSGKEYSWSVDGERFYGEFDIPEEAILDAREQNKNVDFIFVGENVPFNPQIDGDDIIERIRQNAYDEVGDIAEIYLSEVSEKKISKLSDMLTDTFNIWAEETGNKVNIWSVENVKEYECEKYVKNNEKNCNKCGFKTQITAQDGWTFYGCHCPPYKGKHCAEIKECPLWRNEK